MDALSPHSSPWKRRVLPAAGCLVSVILCLLYAWTRSSLPDWWRGHGGGIPYVLFWILLWYTLIPSRSAIVPICIGCVVATCGLEFLQMYSGPEWFDDFRRTRFGAAWLGFGFDWNDIPPYFIGGLLGWGVGWMLPKDPDASVTN